MDAMTDATGLWPLEAIRQAVLPALGDFSVELVPQIDSTNSELMRRARAGRFEPVLLVALQQNAGRGRQGRQWHSDGVAAPGASLPGLTFSLGLPLAPLDWSGLSLAAGLSVATSLHPDLRLKWPNDLWLADRKLAGILIETTHVADRRYAVIGVGLNLLEPQASGLSTAPAWLTELLPEIDGPQALLRLAAPLVQAVKRFEAQGFAPLRKAFEARDALRERPVLLSDGTQGVAQGVDATGALLLRTACGLIKVTSSEVSVRPASTQSSQPSQPL